MRRIRTFMLLLMGGAILATTSCNKELNEKVIGEWQCVYLKVGEEAFSRDGMKKTFEFFDGTREAEKKIAELFPKYKFLTRGEYIRTLGGVVTRGKWSIKKTKLPSMEQSNLCHLEKTIR